MISLGGLGTGSLTGVASGTKAPSTSILVVATAATALTFANMLINRRAVELGLQPVTLKCFQGFNGREETRCWWNLGG